MTEKGYVITICEDRDSCYLPGVEHIERNTPWEFEDDAAAAKGAELDGVKLIYGLQGVDDGVYLDTLQNRAQIAKAKDLTEKGHDLNGGECRKKEFITDETAIALARAISGGVDAFSQKLQDLGFESASKAVDCEFGL